MYSVCICVFAKEGKDGVQTQHSNCYYAILMRSRSKCHNAYLYTWIISHGEASVFHYTILQYINAGDVLLLAYINICGVLLLGCVNTDGILLWGYINTGGVLLLG